MSNDPLNLDEAGEWAGLWWLPDDSDEKVPGVLRYDVEGGLSLSLIGAFEDRIMSSPALGVTAHHEGTRTWDVIHGAAEQREVTLLGCVPTGGKRTMFAWVKSPDKQTVTATTAMLGQTPPCKACESHDLTTPAGELAALREHQQRLPELVAIARRITREAKAAEAHWKEECRAKGRQVAAALRERDKWREIAQAVEEDHRAEKVGGALVCSCRTKGCRVGPTIEQVRDDQRDRAWRNHDFDEDYVEPG